MDGTTELLQLAHLLRVGADTARDIATMRKINAVEITALARKAEIMADELEKIARTPMGDGRSLMAEPD